MPEIRLFSMVIDSTLLMAALAIISIIIAFLNYRKKPSPIIQMNQYGSGATATSGGVAASEGGYAAGRDNIIINRPPEENKNKKDVAKVLLPEISINQKKVILLANVNKLDSGEEVIKGINRIDAGKIKLKRKIVFDRTIFSTVSNDLRLLPDDVIAKTLQYYALLKDIEDTSEYLISSKDDLDIEKAIKEDQTRDWYKKAGEAKDLGDALIKIFRNYF